MSRKSNLGPKTKDLTGKIFGNLLVIEYIGKNKQRTSVWRCECSCDKKTILEISSSRLNSGQTSHCGCIPINRTHGMSKTKEYRTWISIRERCYNSEKYNYYNYGGRGITVCERWLDKEKGFENFYEDMGPRPSDKHSIDRIDTNGNYCAENCRWATSKEQHANMRRTIKVAYKDKILSLEEWSCLTGINVNTLRSRYRKNKNAEFVLRGVWEYLHV